MEDYGAFCECEGYSEFASSSLRKARKQHQCDECFAPIFPGETYEYAAGKQEGDMWENKACRHCLALIEWITAHVPCYCRTYGGLFNEEERFEDMVRQAGQTPGFAFGMLRRVVAIRRNKTDRFSRRAAQCSAA